MSHTIPPKPTVSKTCPECEFTFSTVQPSAVFCSNACRQRAYNKRRTIKIKEIKEEFAFQNFKKSPMPSVWNAAVPSAGDTNPSPRLEEEDTFQWPEMPKTSPNPTTTDES
jgi:hypothetical protein